MEYRGHGRWEQKRLPATPAPKGTPRLKKITYKPEWDEPVKKPAKKKAMTKRKKTTTANPKSVAQPKKQLPPMKKPGWFW